MIPEATWWRSAVIYQVYVRSFADSDGDGLGDLDGIRQHLDHVASLGADAIWLNPFYPSPQADGGYDVADHCDVDPRFGTLATFDALVAEAHERNVRVIVDLVPNHTSSEHPWFVRALAAPPGDPARARFLFRDGRGPRGDLPPNGWQSVFGGPAWTRPTRPDGLPEQWYLHLFAAEQPDLDWTNPEVVAMFDDVLRFWLDRGVDGFRIDVAHGLAKDPELGEMPEGAAPAGPAVAGHPHWDRDEVHDIHRRWRRVLDERGGDHVFVAEAWVATPRQLARYVRDDELHTAFNFELLLAPWDAEALRAAITLSIDALHAVGAPSTWVLENHDVERMVTRYGGGADGLRRARAANLLVAALPGSLYVYQGQELGLPEVVDLPDALRQDPTFHRTGGAERGRDGCRVPLPWDGDRPPFAFTAAPVGWLPQPDDWGALSVAAQERDPASALALLRRALAVRRAHPDLGDGDLTWLDAAPGVLAFERGPGFVCAVNVGDAPAPYPPSCQGVPVLLWSGPDEHDEPDGVELPPASTTWFGMLR